MVQFGAKKNKKKSSNSNKEAADQIDMKAVANTLQEIYRLEMSGHAQYKIASYYVNGKDAATLIPEFTLASTESSAHADMVIDKMSKMGIAPDPNEDPYDPKDYEGDTLLKDAYEHEGQAIAAYKKLLKLVTGKNPDLEDLATQQIVTETTDQNKFARLLGLRGKDYFKSYKDE